MGIGQSKARSKDRRITLPTRHSLTKSNTSEPKAGARGKTIAQSSRRLSALFPKPTRRREELLKSHDQPTGASGEIMDSGSSSRLQHAQEARDIEMGLDRDALDASSSSASSLPKGRRRTRSAAQRDAKDALNGDELSQDVASSPHRRVRRRTQEHANGPEIDERSRKGKGKSENEGSSIGTAFTAMEGAEENLSAQEVDSDRNGSSDVAYADPSGMEASQSSLAHAAPRQPSIESEMGQTRNSLDETSEPIAAANSGSIQQSQSTTNAETSNGEARHRTRLQEIAQALNNNAARRIASAQESGSEQPSMLSALLSDILGLRGGRPNTGHGVNPSNQGQGDRLSDNAADSSARAGTGGTSVIVQGALVSRTLPSRTQNSNASEASDRPTATAAAVASTSPPPDLQEQSTSTLNTEPGQARRTANLGEGLTGDGEAQAATVEEQASMLVRLLSIAAAATAASLLSSAPAQRSSQAQDAAGNHSSNAGANTTASAPAPQPTASSSTEAQFSSRPRSASSSSTPASSHSMQDSSTSSAWASQTFQSLRSRIASLGNRLRGRRTTVDGQRGTHPRRRNSSFGSFGGVRRVFDPPHSASHPTARADSDSATNQTADSSDTPTLASLSNMLRDAIREGMQGSSSRGAQQARPTRPPMSSIEVSQAQSRIRSVNATLQAVRDGQLTPGAEGSFDRFLFDLSGDLDSAVRGLPANAEDGRANDEAESANVDENTQTRRRRDTQGGQLSFFRLFTFPENRTATVSDSSSSNSLFPCILIGVRTLDPTEMNGSDPLAAFAEDTNGAGDGEEGSTEPDRSAGGPVSEDSAQTGSTAAAAAAAAAPPGSPMSRYLLFVSGGHYPRHHPLFHASDDEASRDVMVLMEFLGAIAAFHVKPTNTVTQEQIAKSSLRKVNGSVREIETLAKLHQVMENTSERCLICLEDWQDEDSERRLLDCGHLFHAPCLDQWLVSSNNSCPLCRRQAVSTDDTGPPASAPAANTPRASL